MATDLALWLSPHPSLEPGQTPMQQLFMRLSGKYPGRWAVLFRSEREVRAWETEWAEAFVHRQISPHEITRGLEACNDLYLRPPSLAEFLRACRPPVDPETAYREACRQMARRLSHGDDVWSHPVVYWAAVGFGAYDLRRSSWESASVRWRRILQDLVASGPQEPVPAARRRLGPQPDEVEPLSRDEAALRLAELREMVREWERKAAEAHGSQALDEGERSSEGEPDR